MSTQTTPDCTKPRESAAGRVRSTWHTFCCTSTALVMFALAPALLVSPALAKEPVDFFGGLGTAGGQFGSPGDIGINQSGAGPANPGDIYVVDKNRIQRFGHDDNGTPGDSSDDTYFFISAWGADVDSTPAGGSDYEICTAAADCKAAVSSSGNGTPAGNGSLSFSKSTKSGIAVDEDTGEVYVADSGNYRVNVYAGDGTFLRSFGFDVVKSGPGHVSAPDEQQQLTVKASGGKFSLSFADQATGSRGTGSRGKDLSIIKEVETIQGTFAVGQSISGKGIAPGTTITAVDQLAENTLSVSQPLTEYASAAEPFFGDNFDHNASASQLEAALNALPSIGGVGGSVTVSGGPGSSTGSSPYTIDFGGTLSGEDVPQIVPTSGGLINSVTASATVTQIVKGGNYEVCEGAAGDVCQSGSPGNATGQLAEGQGIAVSQPDGNAATGAVFLADSENQRVDTFDLDGSSPSSFGSAAVFGENRPGSIAIDSRGIVYATGHKNNDEIERYDTENANGGGVGFLAPIVAPTNEVQELIVDATAGQLKLTFEGQTTADIPFNTNRDTLTAGLEALSTIGPGNITIRGGEPSQFPNIPPGHYEIVFRGSFANKDVPELTVSNGTTPLSGGSGASFTTKQTGHTGPLIPAGELNFQDFTRLAIDPDSDGAGPDTDVLYAIRNAAVIQQFGSLNQPGLSAPPTAEDTRHGTQGPSGATGLAVEQSTGRLYVPVFEGAAGIGVYVLDAPNPTPPSGSLDSLSGKTSHSVIAHATIDPNGRPDTSYRFEYSKDGVKWTSTPTVNLGHPETPQAVEATIDPPPGGLEPKTLYHVRLVFQRRFSPAVTTPELTFTTDPSPPVVETVGAPLRSDSTAQLEGRVAPRSTATTYHFEYGTEGPCDTFACTIAPAHSAGSGAYFVLVSEPLQDLEPATTYHYRVVAENGIGPAVPGADMTVTTKATEVPLSHGHLPGPPGSDRAWEMVSLSDSGGNPTLGGKFSPDGNRAVYGVSGGTPLSDSGSPAGQYFAQRVETAPHQGAWQTQLITPSRDQLIGPDWGSIFAGGTVSVGASDFSALISKNSRLGDPRTAVWRLGPGLQPQKLFQNVPPQTYTSFLLMTSEDTEKVAAPLKGPGLDPAYLAAGLRENVYDVGGGSPQLISLLPDDVVAACGVTSSEQAYGLALEPAAHSLSADGRFFFFPSRGAGPCDSSTPSALYARDLIAGETKLISGSPVSGPECSAAFLRSTPEAAFFWTQSRLAVEDTAPASCPVSGIVPDGDVYRYDLEDGSRECVTCVIAGGDVDMPIGVGQNESGKPITKIGVSTDGSRVYFRSAHSLLPGAPPDAAYRVEVGTGALAYLGPIDTELGMLADATPDGSALLFTSQSPALNPLGGGTDNGGDTQLYRYDDSDGSLACISCPPDGSAPDDGSGAGKLDDDGKIIAFSTSTSLVGPDQNADTDVYEWRDGRLLLVTEGLRGGNVIDISASGHDIFFQAFAQYTQDALDAYNRIYDARIGGGFQFPKPPPPCPLEVCQGIPKGAPEEQEPGTGNFVGPGNVAKKPASCRKGKVRRKGRCAAKKPKAHKRRNRAANHNGRAHR